MQQLVSYCTLANTHLPIVHWCAMEQQNCPSNMPKIKQYTVVLIWCSYPLLLHGTDNSYVKYWKAGGSDSMNGPYINAPFMY
jgi:hypothetical protein